MAGHRRGKIFEPACEAVGGVPFGKFVGKLAHQADGIHFAEHGRRLAHGDRPRAEAFDGKAKAGELRRMRHQSVAIVFGQIDDFRDQQSLRRDGP
ncbi:hypothetical protein D9M72_617230 [compost metagenome]